MTYKELSIGDVPHKKLTKAARGGTLTLTKHELAGSSHKIHLHPESHAKVMKAKRAGKGVRLHITHDEIRHGVQHGGSIWGSIWNGVKSLWQPVIKPALSAAADVGIPALATAVGMPELGGIGRSAVKSLTGVGVAHHHRGGKLVKGSQAAKIQMAKIRSKRMGGSFIL